MDNIKNDRICLFDSSLIDVKRTTAYKIYHSPKKSDIVMNFDKPWEKDVSFMCLVKEPTFLRLYYLAGKRVNDEQTSYEMENTFKVCYAESVDGLNWTRPSLGICEFDGSTDNNIIINKTIELYVFKDTNPCCSKEERYKALYQQNYKLYYCYSEDGIHFSDGKMVSGNSSFDTLNTAFYDEIKNKYVAYVRGMHRLDGSDFPIIKNMGAWAKRYAIIRDIRVMYSDDFVNWSFPERINIKDFNDPNQLYSNNIQKYYRAPKYTIGFPNRYNERKKRWTKSFDDLCGLEFRKNRFQLSKRYGTVMTDCVFISSLDGKNFEISDSAFIKSGREERQDGWLYGDCYPVFGLVETKNNLYGYNEISMYCFEGLWGFDCKLARYTLRPDGFASYSAKNQELILKTKKLIFDGTDMELNFSTSAMGFVKVIISDGKKKLCSGELFGDRLNKKAWFKNGNLKDFSGKEVTIAFILKEADLYSFRFYK